VNRTTTDCDFDVSITTNLEAQCLKCADLAALVSGGNNIGQVQGAANLLIGNTTGGANRVNIFTVCDDADPRPAFNALGEPLAVETTFDRCLDNAGINPGNGTLTTMMQAQPSSLQALQENSLTTNVKPEAEISSFNSEAQNPNLNALYENPHVKGLLENPNLNALLANPDRNAILEDPSVKALLEDHEVNALLQDPAIKAHLQNQ
jgi:hypothetical protein